MKFVLASQSPRRRELLSLTGLEFEIVPTHSDESQGAGETPIDYACRLSRDKARAAAAHVEGTALIIAADTIVVDGDEVLGKPENISEATATLTQLRGRTHHVITAVTLYDTARDRIISEHCRSPVMMRNYTDEEIAAYIATGDPFDKAGAYAIQNEGFHPALVFAHCFANVMGLPLCHINRMLWKLGYAPPVNVPDTCQTGIGYTCPVYRTLLEPRS